LPEEPLLIHPGWRRRERGGSRDPVALFWRRREGGGGWDLRREGGRQRTVAGVGGWAEAMREGEKMGRGVF
jgi:hypothetical protein